MARTKVDKISFNINIHWRDFRLDKSLISCHSIQNQVRLFDGKRKIKGKRKKIYLEKE